MIQKQEGYQKLLYTLFCFAVIGLLCVTGCPLRQLFHIRCPGCGLTHAWLSFLSGNLRRAFSYHPLFLFAPMCILLFIWMDYIPLRVRDRAKQFMIGFAVLNACCYLFLLLST